MEEKEIEIELDNKNENDTDAEKSKKPSIKLIIISFILMCLVFFFARYLTDTGFRNYINSNLLGKQVKENELDFIEINSDDNPFIFAYSKYIGILQKNKIVIYNSKAEKENEISINISNSIISNSSGNYAVIAEKNGNKIYVLEKTNLSKQLKIDGKINKISINKNGYITVIASNSTYNSIVITFDNNGNEIFKRFYPKTYVMSACISSSNNYIAIGEIDYSGSLIRSSVIILRMSNAEPVYTFNAPENEILININYSGDKAICCFSSSIYEISPSNQALIYTITDSSPFINIDMDNLISIIESESSGLFSYEYKLRLQSTNSNNENIYILNNGLPKTTIANGKHIALNYGNAVDIINSNGSLNKTYLSNGQLKDIVIGDKILGIIYKDKIEIINL